MNNPNEICPHCNADIYPSDDSTSFGGDKFHLQCWEAVRADLNAYYGTVSTVVCHWCELSMDSETDNIVTIMGEPYHEACKTDMENARPAPWETDDFFKQL